MSAGVAVVAVTWIALGFLVAWFVGGAARLGGPNEPAPTWPLPRRISRAAIVLTLAGLTVLLLTGCNEPRWVLWMGLPDKTWSALGEYQTLDECNAMAAATVVSGITQQCLPAGQVPR